MPRRLTDKKSTNKTSRQTAARVMVICCLFLSAFFVARGEHPAVKIYTSADGLGSSFINSVRRDSGGFLWFATRDGLSRYDGREFTTYRIGASDAPPGIEEIFESSGGVYWITTTGGTYLFDPNKSRPPKIIGEKDKNVIAADFITSGRGVIFEDADKNLWSGGSGLFSVKETSGKISFEPVKINFPDEKWKDFQIFKIFQTADRSLWLVTRYGLIRRLPGNRDVFYTFDKPFDGKINDAAADFSGKIWIVSDERVDVFQPENLEEFASSEFFFVRRATLTTSTSEKFVLPNSGGQIAEFARSQKSSEIFQKVFESSDRHIWLAAGDSVIEFDGQNSRKYGAAQGFPESLTVIAEDAGGNLWFGGQNGAARLIRSGMEAFSTADGLQSNRIQSLYSRSDGEFHVVTGDGFISRFDGEKFETVRLPFEKDAAFLWLSNVAFPDSRGAWWVLAQNKLYRFAATADFKSLATQKPQAIYTQADGLKSDAFFRMFEDSGGDLWISTRDREQSKTGLTLYSRSTEKFRVFDETDGFPAGKSPVSFAEQADGTLWFGFYEDGLIRFKDGKFAEISANLPKGFFSAIYVDRKNRLWLASANSGVTRFDDPSDLSKISARFTTENGLSSNNARSLVEAANGDIYVGTARGVDLISEDGKIVRHFSASDGLSGDFVGAAARDSSGALWFGSPNGLSRFVPKTKNAENVPPVRFGNLRVAGENRFVPPLGATEISGLDLENGQNNLQIDFFAVDFAADDRLAYQYKIGDADWSEPSAQRTLNFANLAAGNYTLAIRAVRGNNAGEAAILSFKIYAPFYRRPWFIFSAILLAAFGVFALDRFRVKKTREVKNALDISQKSEQAALSSESRYRTLAETASDAIITIDETSRIVYANEAAEKVFGFAPSELVGKSLTDLMPENFRAGHEKGFARYLATKEKHLVWSAIELPGLHKSGAIVPLELSFGEFESNGKRYFTGIARDVSERKRHEAALEKSRTERLAELERVRSRIARDLHDDVGSSLTQIALFSEVAKQTAGAENAEPLEFLVNTSNELVEAMSDIVWAINPAKDRFSDLTQRMRRFASEILSAAVIDLDFTTPDIESSAPLGANLRREIFLVFKESINNIVKHSGAKSVKIDFSARNDFLNLTIGDDGRGFETTENESAAYDWRTAKGGNGLPGMRRRAEELGGDFQVESNLNKGTTIILRVPLSASGQN